MQVQDDLTRDRAVVLKHVVVVDLDRGENPPRNRSDGAGQGRSVVGSHVLEAHGVHFR